MVPGFRCASSKVPSSMTLGYGEFFESSGYLVDGDGGELTGRGVDIGADALFGWAYVTN